MNRGRATAPALVAIKNELGKRRDSEISAEIGMTQGAVSAYRRKLGIPSYSSKNIQVTLSSDFARYVKMPSPEFLREIIEWYKSTFSSTLTTSKIAALLYASIFTVKHWRIKGSTSREMSSGHKIALVMLLREKYRIKIMGDGIKRRRKADEK